MCDRYRAQGHKGYWWQAETMDWVTEDDAAWKRKQSGRKGKEGEAGAEDAGTGAEVYILLAGRPRILEGLEWEVVAGDTAEQGGAEEGLGDSMKEAVLPRVSEECQAWKEAALVATGEMEVSRLRTGCREKQVQTEDEVQVVATAVEAEGSRGALGKRGRRGGGQRKRGRRGGGQQGNRRRRRYSPRGRFEATEDRGVK